MIGKGFIEYEWKAVLNSLLQCKHVWEVQMDKIISQNAEILKFLTAFIFRQFPEIFGNCGVISWLRYDGLGL